MMGTPLLCASAMIAVVALAGCQSDDSTSLPPAITDASADHTTSGDSGGDAARPDTGTAAEAASVEDSGSPPDGGTD